MPGGTGEQLPSGFYAFIDRSAPVLAASAWGQW